MWQNTKAAQPPTSFRRFSTIRASLWMNHSARWRIARAYPLSGDTVKAINAYQDFFALWKDADPDIPIIIAAESEYAKLR
jgi:hypothetical protein